MLKISLCLFVRVTKKMVYLIQYEIVNLLAQVVYIDNACYGTTAFSLICKQASICHIFPSIFKNILVLYQLKYFLNIIFCNLFKD